MAKTRIEAQISAAKPDLSVLLSASAGSGKTHVLVRRIIHLLSAGATPESVTAITFTEKAAAQMKDRLFSELAGAAWRGDTAETLLALEPSDTPYLLKKSPEEILAHLTARPDSPAVSTIHAYCLALLRRFPLEAGLPPDFGVMDESEIPIRRELAVQGALDAVGKGELSAEFETLTAAGLDVNRLEDMLALALEKRSRISKLMVDAGEMDGLIGELERSLDIPRKQEAANKILKDIKLKEDAGNLSTLLNDYSLAGPDAVAALKTLSEPEALEGFPEVFERFIGYMYNRDRAVTLKKNYLTISGASEAIRRAEPSLKGDALKGKANMLKERHDGLYIPLRDMVTTLAGLYDEITAGRALAAFLRLYGKADEIYRAMSLRDGLVDYDDLEIYAYRLVTSGGAAVNLRLEAGMQHCLVDEFQDTSDIQWGILRRLSAEAFAGEGPEWPAASTFFAVGDVKQSIYRFREANYRLMDYLKTEMRARMRPDRCAFPELDLNFRSAPEILRVVNETFGGLWGKDYAHASPAMEDAKGGVTLKVVPQSDEADALAEELSGALGLPIRDDEVGVVRQASYGDMAVLIRSRAGLKSYEDRLRGRGIPFRVVGGVGFFFQDEVQAVLGVLNYLSSPTDLLSLASALKSPLFGLSDSEIAPLFSSVEPMEALRLADPEAASLIASWRAAAGIESIGLLVERIARESAAMLAFGARDGAAAALNIEKLIGLAREFDRRGGVGLPDFTEWVKAYREKADLPTADVDMPGAKGYVSIMTVHAAKGLEFPVVFLPGMGRRPRKSVEGFLAADYGESAGKGMALGTRALLGESASFSKFKEYERTERVNESRRLLYVAMTRARDYLVMLAGVNPDKTPDEEAWISSIFEAFPKSLLGNGPKPGEVPATYRYPASAGSCEASLPETLAPHMEMVYEAPSQENLAPLPTPEGVVFVSPSALVRAVKGEAVPSPDAWARLRGELIHRAIESYGLTGRLDMPRAAKAAGVYARLDKTAAERLIRDADDAVKALLAEERFKKLLTGGPGKYFEMPLLLKIGNRVVSGSADLVVIEGGRATVVDYKTGFQDTPVEVVIEAYAPQLEMYCEGVKAAFGVVEAEPWLLLVDRRELIPGKTL